MNHLPCNCNLLDSYHEYIKWAISLLLILTSYCHIFLVNTLTETHNARTHIHCNTGCVTMSFTQWFACCNFQFRAPDNCMHANLEHSTAPSCQQKGPCHSCTPKVIVQQPFIIRYILTFVNTDHTRLLCTQRDLGIYYILHQIRMKSTWSSSLFGTICVIRQYWILSSFFRIHLVLTINGYY